MHMAIIIIISSAVENVVTYNNYIDNLKCLTNANSSHPECQSGQWGLTDVTLSSQLGREDRVREKRRKIEAARQQHTTAQPQATCPRAALEREQILEKRAQEAERREQEFERRVELAERMQHEAEVRTQEAEKRCHSAEERVRDTVLKHHETEASLVEMEKKNGEEITELMHQLTQAERKRCEAENQAMEAEEKRCEAEKRALEARIKQCEGQEDMASRARKAEVKELEVQGDLHTVEQRLHASEQRCHDATSREHAAMQRIEAVQSSLQQAEQLVRRTETEKQAAEQHAKETEVILSQLQDRLHILERKFKEQLNVLQTELGEAQKRNAESEAAHQNAQHIFDELRQSVDELRAMITEQQAARQTAEDRVQELEGELEDLQIRMEEFTQSLRGSEAMVTEQQAARQTAEDRVQELEGELEDLQTRIEEFQERAQQLETQWVVERGEIQLTEEEKGRGGWAVVRVANFRGIRVAAKCLHEQISEYYSDLFTREMNMAARFRHPNLVQFIGATRTGKMIILTELMPTSLRAVLEQRAREHKTLEQIEVISISLDIARALNYLHLTQPEPLIHRDISSANVLLEPGPNNSWKAKVSDYGSVNLQRQLNTIGPGSPVYAAPEANIPDQQSPKMDIFSFGVLLIEMCTVRFPEVAARQRLIRSIQYPHFVELIGRCMSRQIDSRPSASEIITQLTQLRQL